MGRAERITTCLKISDYKLFCRPNHEGKLCVYRKEDKIETYILDDGNILSFVRPTPHLVFALTHNWKPTGYSVDWGIEVIAARLKAHDLWNRDLVADLMAEEEKHQVKVDRQRRNSTEDFLYEFRDDFKKTFNDVNVANLSKKKKQINKLKEF